MAAKAGSKRKSKTKSKAASKASSRKTSKAPPKKAVKAASKKAAKKTARKPVKSAAKAAKKTVMAKADATADLGKLKVTHFSALVGTEFGMTIPAAAAARTGNAVVPLKLVKAHSNGVQRHESSKPEDKVRAGGGFSLEFVALAEHGLPQGIYRLQHPKLGKMDIFLVPSGPLHGGFGYHTAFG